MKRKFFAYPYIVWMILFIAVPMLFIFYYAFNVNGEWTTERFTETFTNGDYWLILLKSIEIALITTVICLLLGYPIAYILSNMKKSVAAFISVLFFIPMWMNFVLRTYAWHAILEFAIPKIFGFKVLTGQTSYTIAVLVVMVYDFLPFMVLPLYNTLSKMDKSLLEASRDLGANSAQTFFRVVLPLSIPGIVSGVTMVFIPAITAFTVTEMIGHGKPYMFGNVIEFQFKNSSGNMSVGSTLAIILLVCVMISTLIMNHFDKDKEGGSIL